MDRTFFVELEKEVQALMDASVQQEDLEPFVVRIRSCCRELREEFSGEKTKFTRFSLTLINDALIYTPVSTITPGMTGTLLTVAQAFSRGLPDQKGYATIRNWLGEAGFYLIPEPPQHAA